MIKRLILIYFVILAFLLFSIKTEALSFSTEQDLNTKGDWLIRVNKLDESFNDINNVFKVNLFTSGFEIKEIIFNKKLLPLPTCNNQAFFKKNQICFDAGVIDDIVEGEDLFTIRAFSTNINSIKIFDETKQDSGSSKVLPSISIDNNKDISESPSNQPIDSSFIILSLVFIVGLVIIIILSVKFKNRFAFIFNSISLLLLLFLVFSILNIFQQESIIEIDKSFGFSNKPSIDKCKRTSLLVGLQENNNDFDFSSISQRIIKADDLGFNIFEIRLDNNFAYSNKDLFQIYNLINARDEVEFVEFSCPMNIAAVPNDPSYKSIQQKYMKFSGFEDVWNTMTASAEEIVIADIDMGYVKHREIDENIWINEDEEDGNKKDDDKNGMVDDVNGWNFSSDSNEIYSEGGVFASFHGTTTASVIGASGNNGVGMTGGLWKTQLMMLDATEKTETGGHINMALALKAISYATKNKASIMNISWGKQYPPDFVGLGGETKSLCKALKAFGDIGGVVVIAAGNLNEESSPHLDHDNIAHDYPCDLKLDNVICVGALAATFDQPAWFSHYGKKSVDLFAPGEEIAMLSNGFPPSSPEVGSIYVNGGTSYAAPLTASAVALYRSKYPEATPLQIKFALIQSVKKVKGLKGLVVSDGTLDVKEFLNTHPDDLVLPEEPESNDPCFLKGGDPKKSPTPTNTKKPKKTPTTTEEPEEPIQENRCLKIDKFVGEKFYCDPTGKTEDLIYCNEFQEEQPDKSIQCTGSECIYNEKEKKYSCSIDRCEQIGGRWLNKPGSYCSKDLQYLIYCDDEQKENLSKSKKCKNGCVVGDENAADKCLDDNDEPIDDPIEPTDPPKKPIDEVFPKLITCGPMDQNNNGRIDYEDFSSFVYVYSPSYDRIKECTDGDQEYLPKGPKDANHDGIVDIQDLAVFIQRFIDENYFKD